MAWATPVIQLVTAGGFGALVWYFVVKHIPAIEARHRVDRTEWMETYREERQRWADSHEKRDQEFLKAIQKLSESVNLLRSEITKSE